MLGEPYTAYEPERMRNPGALGVARVQNQQVRGNSNMIQTQTNPQTIPKTITFDEFAAWYPENSIRRYELHNGVIVEMPLGTGRHSRVTGFTWDEISAEIRRLKLPCFIPGDCLLKPVRNEAGYQPDVVVLDEAALANEPRWDRESIITMGFSVRLAVEVVSTNWRDDYHFKFADYEEMGIPEYWIVDYLGFGWPQVHRQPQTTHPLGLPIGRWGVPGQTVSGG